ncbi:hypothetical protein ACFOY2_36085 [Nonomuraea purpurea]|uniref:Uncharacterized protein n=1 Tax=Nonomuraea purpurea TaxID=1849276 RepID=A0ABV8GIB8_9ACTN
MRGKLVSHRGFDLYGATAGGIGTPGDGEEVSAMSSSTVVPPVRRTRG